MLAMFWNLALHFPAKCEYLRGNFFNVSVLVLSCPASPSKPTSSIRKQILPIVVSSIFRPCSHSFQPCSLKLPAFWWRTTKELASSAHYRADWWPLEHMRRWTLKENGSRINDLPCLLFRTQDIKRHWGRAMLGKINIFPDLTISLFKKIYNTHESQMSHLIVHNYTDV